MVEDIISEAKGKMKSALGVYEQDLQGMRSGRASPALVERMHVEYYGSEMELRQMASISIPEPMQILIRPFDKGTVKAIEKAIRTSDININPAVDGDAIRLNLPPLTRERRLEMVKMLSRRMEDARVAVRNIRRNSNDDLKEYEKEKLISEDESKRAQEEIQKLTDKAIADIEDTGKQKEKEILEV